MSWLKNQMDGEGGYRDVTRVAIPLVLSTSAWTIQHFVDRMFLTWVSPDAVAASMAGGILQFTIVGLFLGTAGYANTFVAQYVGAGRPERVGPAIWQGLYFCLFSSVFAIPMVLLADPLFDWIGHEPAIAEQEKIYFRILWYVMFFHTSAAVMPCFYTGRAKTWTVMWVNVVTTIINGLLDYAMIFGHWGFPAMGIRGAAIATAIALVFNATVFFLLLMQKKYRDEYAMLSGWRFDPELFRRFLRFGVPSGLQLSLDVLSWTLFIMIIGRIGKAELAITSIAFNINMLAFVPMIGCGIAVTTLVGQYLGQNRPALARRACWSSFHLSTFYMTMFSLAYLLVPDLFFSPFAAYSDPEQFEVLRQMGHTVMKFMAFYCLFDTMNIIFSGTLKGAGDTRFVMKACVGLGWLLMVLPMSATLYFGHLTLNLAWLFATVFICSLGLVYWKRVWDGQWESMRVIEPEALGPLIPLADSSPTETP